MNYFIEALGKFSLIFPHLIIFMSSSFKNKKNGGEWMEFNSYNKQSVKV